MKLNRRKLRKLINEVLIESFKHRGTDQRLYLDIQNALISLGLLRYDGGPIDTDGLRYDSQEATFHLGNTPIMIDGQFAQNKIAIQVANILGRDSSPDVYHDRGYTGTGSRTLDV